MKIKSLQLKNGYKRFHDLTIDLGDKPPRIVALVGPNGCGKSSVLDGMLWRLSQHQPIGGTGQKGKDYHAQRSDNQIDRNDVIIEFEEGAYDTVIQSRKRQNQMATLFSFRSPYRYNNQAKINETKATSDIALNNYGAGNASAIDEKMIENYRRLYAWYGQYRDENNLRPSDAKARIIGQLNKSLRACLDVEIDSIGNVEADQGTLYFKKPDQPDPFEFDVLSAGEKEVVDILLDLYLRRPKYTDTVFLIDEPELHISTAIQKKLLVEINKLIPSNCQLWIATHSIGLLRALQEDLSDKCEVIYFDPSFNLGNETCMLKPIRKSAQNWRKIFATALDDLVELISPKRLIYCEGKAEPKQGREDGLDADVFNTVFGEAYDDTQFISAGGHTQLEQHSDVAIEILTKVFSNLEVLVLKDRDFTSGKKTTQHDRGVHLKTNSDNLRVLVRWEIENYLFDKEVLQAYCEQIGTEFDEALYDANVDNIEDEEVKELTGIIKKACGITASINREKFKRELAKAIKPTMTVYRDLEACIFGHLARAPMMDKPSNK